MVSSPKSFQIIVTALAFFLFAVLCHAGEPKQSIRHDQGTFESTDLVHPEEVERAARRTAARAAAHTLKTTRIGQRINRFKQSVIQRYQFEFKKEFKTDNPPLPGGMPDAADGEESPASQISFSGKFSENMSPVVAFSTRFSPVDIVTQLDGFDRELTVEISSRPVNRITGAGAVLGITMDGGETQALLKVEFRF